MEILTRAADDAGAGRPVPLHALPTQQRRVLDFIRAYDRATGQPCPVMTIARGLRKHHSVIQDQLLALHRKGWLRSPGAPAWLRDRR